MWIYQWLQKYCCILGRIRTKWGAGGQVWFVSNTVEQCWGGPTPWKFWNSHLKLETVLPAINWYKLLNKYEHSSFLFLDNKQFNDKLGPGFS